MAITKTNTPYEFLVRWTDGTIAGAHVRFLETISEDGTVLTQKEGNAMPVSMAGEAGYPLADILSSIQTQAIIEREDAVAAKATAEAALAQAIADKDAAVAAATAPLQAEIARLTALVPAPVTATGIVTMRQARLALLQVGKYADVSTAIASMPEPQKTAATIEWEYASTVERSSAFVASMATALGLTEAEMDSLFTLAASL